MRLIKIDCDFKFDLEWMIDEIARMGDKAIDLYKTTYDKMEMCSPLDKGDYINCLYDKVNYCYEHVIEKMKNSYNR